MVGTFYFKDTGDYGLNASSEVRLSLELDSGKLLYSLEVRRPRRIGQREPYSPYGVSSTALSPAEIRMKAAPAGPPIRAFARSVAAM